MNTSFWVEKYRPKTIDQYVFHDKQHETSIRGMLESNTIPHLLLYGTHGSGKTTLAQILISRLTQAQVVDESDVLTINASDDRGIDVFRDAIKSFAGSMPLRAHKIVHLEEADQLTPTAQNALKAFMEDNIEYVRFILTCNNVAKILPPVRSRCSEFMFKASDIDEVTVYACRVLTSEKVKFSLDDVDKVVTSSYPDIRKIINTLQKHTHNGHLSSPSASTTSGEYRERLFSALNNNDWATGRKIVCELVPPDEYIDVFRLLYQHAHTFPAFKAANRHENVITVVAEHLYKHAFVSDPEINLAAMFIRIGQLTHE